MKRKTLCIFAPSPQSPGLFMPVRCTACYVQTYAIVHMLVIILFLLVLPASSIKKLIVGRLVAEHPENT